jgi:hypothetical protein
LKPLAEDAGGFVMGEWGINISAILQSYYSDLHWKITF